MSSGSSSISRSWRTAGPYASGVSQAQLSPSAAIACFRDEQSSLWLSGAASELKLILRTKRGFSCLSCALVLRYAQRLSDATQRVSPPRSVQDQRVKRSIKSATKL